MKCLIAAAKTCGKKRVCSEDDNSDISLAAVVNATDPFELSSLIEQRRRRRGVFDTTVSDFKAVSMR